VRIVKINAITVPRERFEEFERRFASRAGRVDAAPGFEGFELLRPNDDREMCLGPAPSSDSRRAMKRSCRHLAPTRHSRSVEKGSGWKGGAWLVLLAA
jgi:hypothetical protein